MQDTSDTSDKGSPHNSSAEGPFEPGVDAGSIAYLLQEMDKWVEQGVLSADAYEGLSQRYKAKHEEILRLGRVDKLLTEARLARKQACFADVISRALEAIKLDPSNIECTRLLADTYETSGLYTEALSAYESLRAVCPGDADAHNGLARVREALDTQRRAQEQAAALAGIAELGRNGQAETAMSQCEAFVAEYPSFVDGHVLLASFYHGNGRIEDSIGQIKQALALAPNDPRLTRRLFDYEQAYARAHEEERIRRRREQAEETNLLRRLKAQEMADQAREALAQGRFVDALKAANGSIGYDPQNAETWALVARAYSAQEMWKQSEDAWTEAARRSPHDTGYRDELRKVTAVRVYQERPLWSKLWDKGSQAMEAFMEERNVQWVHLLGAAILLAGLIGVSAWIVTVQKLWGIVGRVLVAVVPLILTALFYYAGCRLRSVLKATATSFHVIASSLLPIDLVMMKHLFPDAFRWNWDQHLFAVCLISTLVYILVLVAIRSRVIITLAGVGFLATSLFFMRGFTSLAPSSQGLWFSIVGFGYMLVARWIRRRGWERLDSPLNFLSHAAMALALGSSMVAGPTAHSGEFQASFTVLAVSLAYVLAAYLLDEARYLPVFAVTLFGFTAITLKSHGTGIDQWYLYGLSFGILGCAFLAIAPISRAQQRDDFAGWYQWFGLAVTAIAVLPTLGRGLMQAAMVQSLPSGPELLPSLLTCLVISISYAAFSVWMDKPRLAYGAAVVFIYSAVLTIRLASRPSYEYTVWMLLLAVIMVACGWYLRRRSEEHGSVIFNTGVVLSVLSGTISVGMWAYHGIAFEQVSPGYREAAILVMLISTVLYAVVARLTHRVAYVSAAIVSCALAWGAVFSWLDDRILASVLGREINYGLYYLPFVGMLVWMRHVFLKRGNPEFAAPCDAISLLMSVGLMALQACYLVESDAMRHSLWLALVLCSALFAWQSWDRREENLFGTRVSAASVYAYMSLSAFWAAAFYLLDGIGLHRSLTALVTILLGSVGASIAASRLTDAAKLHWNRALLVSGAAVFAYGCLYAFFWDSSTAVTMAIGLVVVYVAAVYTTGSEDFATESAFGFGAGYLAVCAAAYATLPVALVYGSYACVAAALSSGVAFAWLATRLRSCRSAYIATLSATEAASFALFRVLANSTAAGSHRVGFAVISALLLTAAWVLFRRRDRVFAEAPFVVGLAMLSTNVLVSVAVWLDSVSASDRLVALIVTATASLAYAIASAVLRRPWMLWSATLALSAAYGLAGAQWVMQHIPDMHANYGIWYWPLVAALAVGGHILHRKQQADFARILHLNAAGLVFICLCLQLLYSTSSNFIAFFAYGLLFAWVSVAARAWAEEKPANVLSQGSAYLAAALLSVGWLLVFDWVGELVHKVALYRSVAALTGVVWCLISFRVSAWMSSRDWEWSARPMFWSGVVAGVLWTLLPTTDGQSVLPLWLATCTLAAILYTWIAAAHGNRSFAYLGIGVFANGYLNAFLAYGGLYASPAQLALFSLAPAVMALCMGYLSKSFRSRTLAYVTTLAAEWGCFLLLKAGIEASPVVDGREWYGLGLAVIGLVALCVYRALARKGFEDLAIAPAHGSDLAATIAAVATLRMLCTGIENQWTFTLAMAVCAATYALSAYLRSRPSFLYAASAAVVITWGLVIDLLPTTFVDGHYVLLYLPLVAILGSLSYAIRGRDHVGFANPVWRSAMTLSVACFFVQLALNVFEAPDVSDIVNWIIFSALYAIASYLDRDIRNRAEMLVYFTCASLLTGLNILPLSAHMMKAVNPAMPFAHAALGALWAGAAIYFQSRSRAVWTRPLFVSAGIAEAIAVLTAVNHPLLRSVGWGVAAIVGAAGVFAWMAQKTEKRGLVHLAGCAALGSLGLLDSACLARWVILLPMLIPALGAGVLAQTTRAREYAAWFPILLWTGFAEYAILSPSALLSPTPVLCAVFIVAMGLSAVFFQRLARIRDMSVFEIFAALSGLVAYWCIPVIAHKIIPLDPVEHAAITILPYAVFLAWLTWRLRSSDGKPLYGSYGAVALALSIVGIVAGVASGESLTMRTVTLALYTLAYLVTTARFGSRGLVYMTNASGLITWYMLYLALKLPSSTDALPCLCAWFGLLGLMQVGLGVVFERSEKGSQTAAIECAIGATLCSVSAFAALSSTLYTRASGEWTIAALLMSTVANSTVAMVRRQFGLVHAGFAGVLISLYLIFYDKLDLRVLDIYALPIGIYLLSLPAISRYIGRKVNPGPYYSTGLAIVLGSGLVTLAQTGWSSWNSYVLLGESVVAFLYGVSRRVKVFIFFGTGFSAVWAAALIRDSVVRQMHGSTLVAGILGIIVGTALIAFASRSEQRRTEILDSIRQAARSFREWD